MRLTFGGDRQVREHLALAAKHAVSRAQIEDILIKADPSRDNLHPIPHFPEEFSRERDMQMLEMNGQSHWGQIAFHLKAALMDESAPKFLKNPDEFLSGPKAKVALSHGNYTTEYYETTPLDLFQPGYQDIRRGLNVPDTDSKDVSESTRRKAASQWMQALGSILYDPNQQVPLQDRLPMPLKDAAFRVLRAVEKHLGVRLMLQNRNGTEEPLADLFKLLWSNPYH